MLSGWLASSLKAKFDAGDTRQECAERLVREWNAYILDNLGCRQPLTYCGYIANSLSAVGVLVKFQRHTEEAEE